MPKLVSDPFIDSMQDSYCCLSCHTLSDPFVGCKCKFQQYIEYMKTHSMEESVKMFQSSNRVFD